MGKVLLEMSMSLDGYVAGPDISPQEPLGRGGELLHEWMLDGRSAAESQDFETDHFTSIGALVIGRRMADVGIGPWGDEPTFHAPVFVVTHRPAETIDKRGGTSYFFVTGGIDDALVRARGRRIPRRADQWRRGCRAPVHGGRRDRGTPPAPCTRHPRRRHPPLR